MFIGAYGTFWERDFVDFTTRGWRLLGRQGLNTGTIEVVDFRRARGVYILYNQVGVYYVGLATGVGGIGARLKDHTTDEHGIGWSRFSWFSFDGPSTADQHPDRVYKTDQLDSVELDTLVGIREVEALLQLAMQPFANKSQTRFSEGTDWVKVATRAPDLQTFDALKERL